MKRLIAKDLKIKFVETLGKIERFSYEEGNPFLIKIGNAQYYIFLKNLSSAYFKNSPDITRVQLPKSEHFSKIFKENIPFIILGYDNVTDTIVSWNPKKIKVRLNAKSNISLYSRYSLHKQVNENEFKFGYLANGEKIILFKRSNLGNFFNDFKNIFKENKGGEGIGNNEEIMHEEPINEPAIGYAVNKLLKITDKSLLNQLTPLLLKNQVLHAVEITSKYYLEEYKEMAFKDWYKLINEIYKDINK